MGIIVDVGCGTGNLTNMLSLQIKHKMIIGLDNSDKMIEFAKNNHNFKTSNYVKVDITDDWEQLEDQLNLTERTVDLVVSLYCLHWIKDKQKALENISRLLKPGKYLMT